MYKHVSDVEIVSDLQNTQLYTHQKYYFNTILIVHRSNFQPNFGRIKELNYIVKVGIAALKKWLIRGYSAILNPIILQQF